MTLDDSTSSWNGEAGLEIHEYLLKDPMLSIIEAIEGVRHEYRQERSYADLFRGMDFPIFVPQSSIPDCDRLVELFWSSQPCNFGLLRHEQVRW